jgi:hypothetical protein
MMEGGKDKEGVVPQIYVAPASIQDGGQSSVGSSGSEITAPGGEPEQLFQLRMPRVSADQIKALGGLAAVFGWEVTPVEADKAEAVSNTPTTATGHEIVTSKETGLDPEAAAYMKKYVALKSELDKVPTRGYNHAVEARKPFTPTEEASFCEAGYKSVVDLASTFGRERFTVIAYEEAPGLPAFKVTYLKLTNDAKRKPSELQTFTFHASGGTYTWQKYKPKLFGHAELEPMGEDGPEPMDHHNLDRLTKILCGSFGPERVRNGTWTRSDKLTA